MDHDHSYILSPNTLRRKYAACAEKLKEKDSLIRLQEKKIIRLAKKTSSLKDIILDLKNHCSLSQTCTNALESIADEGVKELWERALKNGDNGISRETYPPALRSFALTLNFYSPKAYEYVREKLNYALPNLRTVRAWYSAIDGEAGFTEESFQALKFKVSESEKKNKVVYCSLTIDEMGIKKGTQRGQGGRMYGHVDFGSDLEFNDDSIEARNALVFMIVCLNESWKLPIAYFLIDKIKSETTSELICNALRRLHEVGVCIVNLTFDGTAEHVRTARLLGAELQLEKIAAFFPHPCTGEKVHIIFDPCHMLKLIRNTLGENKILVDGDGNNIEWQYIEKLEKLQDVEGLRLGNKLRKQHVDFFRSKMKVSLAAQTLSSSVADSLEYCRLVLKLNDFQGSEATERFIRTIDELFDFSNSRNPYGKSYKAPLSRKNEQIWKTRVSEELEYLEKLQSFDKKSIFKGRRCMGFLGLYSACLSVMNIFYDLVNPENLQIKYLLTYKLSQDHLELFFCAVRRCGGWCPNPTCQQFVSAYKKLLIHHEVKSTNGNAAMLDKTSILTIKSTKTARLGRYGKDIFDKVANARIAKKYSLDVAKDDDSSDLKFPDLLLPEITMFSCSAVAYICGFTIRKVFRKIACECCRNALVLQNPDFLTTKPVQHLHYLSVASYPTALRLISIKSNGGLIFPSQSAYYVAIETEKLFRHAVECNAGKVPIEPQFPEMLVSRVMLELLVRDIMVTRTIFSQN